MKELKKFIVNSKIELTEELLPVLHPKIVNTETEGQNNKRRRKTYKKSSIKF